MMVEDALKNVDIFAKKVYEGIPIGDTYTVQIVTIMVDNQTFTAGEQITF